MKRLVVCGCVLLVWMMGPALGWGQGAVNRPGLYDVLYRPPGVTYRVAETPHFDMIYQVGAERETRLMAGILETHLPATDSLIGLRGRGLQMPVVVNAFNDRANGFVSPLPFRQEIEVPRIKDNIITTRFTSWPAAVAPHELVHAAHAEVNPRVGVGNVVRWFAPDWSRVINLTAPAGLIEGIAVHRESQLQPGAGRLNMPLATMKFRAAMLSDDPWSITQMMEAPTFSRPFDRHYLAGGQAVRYMDEHDGAPGADFFHEATRLHHRLPFLGFGVALWHGLGQTPGTYGDQMIADFRAREQARLDSLGPLTEPTVIAQGDGRIHRRPHWIDNETLVAYASGYDLRAGLYRIDAQTGERERLQTTGLTEDFTFSVNRDTTALHVARYVADPFASTKFTAEAERVDLRTGTTERLTDGGRVLAPVEAPDGTLWVVQNDGSFTQWARIGANGAVTPLTDHERARFRQIAPSPDGSTVVVLLNLDGDQHLYRAEISDEGPPEVHPWVRFEEDGVIYDISWGPEGRYLLFAADPSGIANIYALDTAIDQVIRLTNVPFGALEPTLSPDGTTLAFVNYQHEQFNLVRMPFAPESAEPVETAEVIAAGDNVFADYQPRRMAEPIDLGPTRPYEAWRYLWPRMVHPTVDYDPDEPSGPNVSQLGLGVGVSVRGADPLQRWAYQAEGFYQVGRPWGEATVQSGRFLLRPSVSVFDRPFATPVALVRDGTRIGIAQGIAEERGASLGLELPITLQSNVHFTQAQFRLDSEWRQTRLIDEQGSGLTDFRDRLTLNPSMALGYRLRRNSRDLVPSAGLVWSASGEVDVWTDGVEASRALLSTVRGYLPLFPRTNTGIRVGGSVLTQNRGSIFNVDTFVPRGYEDTVLGEGTFARFDAEVTQPLWFIDDGSLLLPLYFEAVYAYGFGQTLQPIDAPFGQSLSSIGGGLGVRFRFFYLLNFDLRIGGAYRMEPGDGSLIFR